MKTLLIILSAIFFIGCGKDDINYGVYTEDVAVGEVRAYDETNEANRVNILITIGQSNSEGVQGYKDINTSNVFVPNEPTNDYPSYVTFSSIENNSLNRAIVYSATNTASKISEKYNSDIPLYVIHLARGGTGVDFHSKKNFWSFNRADTDGISLHPQLIHYVQTIVRQLQDEGKEPYVVGLDYNQWESEGEDSVYGHYETYSKLFDTIETVIPNDDYKLFICYPTATNWGNTEVMQDTFLFIQETRDNVFIYRPLELGVSYIYHHKGHYNIETYDAMANFIMQEIGNIN